MIASRATKYGRDIRVLGALLALALMLAALLAWRAISAVAAQRASATRDLGEEAEFAAYMFATHAGRDVYWGLIDLFAPVAPYDEVQRGGPDVPLETVVGDACEYDYTCDIKAAALAWFRVDLATRVAIDARRNPNANTSRSVDSVLSRLRSTPKPPRFIQIVDARPSGLVMVVATVAKDASGRAAAYGFEVPAPAFASAMIRRSTDGRRPFLPASLRARAGGAVCGDRHSFLAGLLSPTLPPKRFEPIGVEFVTGSISAPGIAEAMEYNLPPTHPLRSLYVYQPPDNGRPQSAINLSILRGVRASLELQRTHDLEQALSLSNKAIAPQLSFADVGGHGFAVVTAAPAALNVEFVCIPRPIERATQADGGPVSYRVAFRVPRWTKDEAPRMTRSVVEGKLPLVP